MQIIDQTLELPLAPLDTLHLFQEHKKQTLCFFDIETTGLSAKVFSLYLIGALWYDVKDEHFHTRQWFADDYISERQILTAFRSFLMDFATLVHYNGSGFDIPYIEKKCREHCLASPFDTIKSLDIYREIRRLKPLFETHNLKLATIEKLVGFMRRDMLTGKDCIQTYSHFMQKKYFRDNSMEQEKQKLLLHNMEDIIGTFYTSLLLSFKCEFSFSEYMETETSIRFLFHSACPFPFPARQDFTGTDDTLFCIDFQQNQVTLEIPLKIDCLYHFFDDYKNYYYLPAEDTAIHKSVAIYVDKEFRTAAKASNCYVRKEGCFLTLPEKFIPEHYTLFGSDYHRKNGYLLWDEKAKQDSSLPKEILHHLLFH